jgi:hypothetical protein
MSTSSVVTLAFLNSRRLQERDDLRSRRGAREPRLFDDALPHRIVLVGRPTSSHFPDEPSGGLPPAGLAGGIRAAYRREPSRTSLRYRSKHGWKAPGRSPGGRPGRASKTDRSCRATERRQLGEGIFAAGSGTCKERGFRRPAKVLRTPNKRSQSGWGRTRRLGC